MVSTVMTSSILYTSGAEQRLLTPAEDAEQYKELVELHKKVNTDGTRNVLAAALENPHATQLLYFGKADIVFDGRDRPMLREMDAAYPPKCYHPELEPKFHGERMVLSFNGVNALRTVVIRPAMMFGCVSPATYD